MIIIKHNLSGWRLLLISGFLLINALSPIQAEETESVDFVRQVRPILSRYCLGCHAGAEPDGEVRLDQAHFLTAEIQDSIRPVVPGKPAESLLLQLMFGTAEPVMPPEGEPTPSAAEKELVSLWIEQGAVIPANADSVAWETPQIAIQGEARNPSYSANWHPSGKLFALGKQNKIELWSAEPRTLIFSASELAGAVTQVKFSRDGQLLLTAGGEPGLSGEIRCYRVEDGQLLWTTTGHSDAIYALAISDSAGVIATGSYDRLIRLWNLSDGAPVGLLEGHHGAVQGLDFHPNGKWLASAADDKTVKIWDISANKRLVTLNEPTAGQTAVCFHPSGKVLVAAGQDKRLRVWQTEQIRTDYEPPILYTRFAHDASILAIGFTPDGKYLISSAEDLCNKVWEAVTFTQQRILSKESEWISSLSLANNPPQLLTTTLDGNFQIRPLQLDEGAIQLSEPIELLPTPPFKKLTTVEPIVLEEQEMKSEILELPVPSRVTGRLFEPAGLDVDLYRFQAEAGVSLILETRGERIKSPIDTKLEILDRDGNKVPWLMLRSVRDSYVTFRPIDSTISGIRMNNWQEIRLNDYVYMAGEVVRIFQLPRGPDADFRFYTQGSKRRCYFGTSGLAHALEDSIYIVEPYAADATFVENGLPVFPVYFENDDEERQMLGRDSRVLFIPPRSGEYQVRVSDVRGFQGEDYKYELHLRTAQPGFQVKLATKELKVPTGSGRTLVVKVDRVDGYEGKIDVRFDHIPQGLTIPALITIEAGHDEAETVVCVAAETTVISPEQLQQMTITASGQLSDEVITQDVAGLVKLEIIPTEKLKLRFLDDPAKPTAQKLAVGAPLEIEIAPGTTTTALLQLQRLGFDGEIKLDVKNLPHGIIVDNIGLNGILIRDKELDRPIYLTAADWVQEQDRWVHAVTLGGGNQASIPVLIKVRKRTELLSSNQP